MNDDKNLYMVNVRLYREEWELIKQLQKKFGLHRVPQIIRLCIHRTAETEGLSEPGFKVTK